MPDSAFAVDAATKTYPGVSSVEATSGHLLIIVFDTGEKKVFDVTPLLTAGRFRELAAPGVFERVRVAFDTVEWENGLDLDPEYLYERGEPYPRDRDRTPPHDGALPHHHSYGSVSGGELPLPSVTPTCRSAVSASPRLGCSGRIEPGEQQPE